MANIAESQTVDIDRLIPYVNNAKQHSDEQVTRIAASIREFGFINPVLIDKEYNIIAGHGRVQAAKKLGLDNVPALFVEGLTDAQRKAYILADNRLGELAEWDMELVTSEIELLLDADFDIDLTGFDAPDTGDWFTDRERGDDTRQEGNDEYNEFLDKFEQKKTTDDCYTPDVVYEAVANWVADTYKIERSQMVRPFYPGGDYQNEKYPAGCAVVDNPPFSILSEIIRFYCDKHIRFFLFAPYLTIFGSARDCDVCYLPADVTVTYENGAVVNTGFITNMDDAKIRSTPTLYKVVQDAANEYRKEIRRELPKYSYPFEVLTASSVGKFSRYGVDFAVYPNQCERVSILDAQRDTGKAIFGGGFFISNEVAAERAAAERAAAERAAAERAAAERAAAERENATVWKLSEREREIIKGLSNE